MRGPEGIATPLPGRSSERPWSKHREPHIRNVEAEGSSPFTSTKSPVQRAKVDPRRITKAPWSATWLCVEVVDAKRLPRSKAQVKGARFGTPQGHGFQDAARDLT